MAALLVLTCGSAVLFGSWLLCRLAEMTESRSVEAFETSRTVLSAVTGRASPEPALAASAPEAHVRVLEGTSPRPRARASAPARRRGRSTGPANRGRSNRSRRAEVAVGADAANTVAITTTPTPAPSSGSGSSARPVLRFDDAAPPAASSAPEPPDQPASRPARSRGPRLAGQAAAAMAAVAAVALLAPSALAWPKRAIPASAVEAAPHLALSEATPTTAPAEPASTSDSRPPVVPGRADDGTLTVRALEQPTSLVMVAREDVWLELRAGDGGGEVIWTGVVPAGDTLEQQVEAPAQLRIGNPRGLRLEVDGREVLLSATSPVDLAITTTSVDGSGRNATESVHRRS